MFWSRVSVLLRHPLPRQVAPKDKLKYQLYVTVHNCSLTFLSNIDSTPSGASSCPKMKPSHRIERVTICIPGFSAYVNIFQQIGDGEDDIDGIVLAKIRFWWMQVRDCHHFALALRSNTSTTINCLTGSKRGCLKYCIVHSTKAEVSIQTTVTYPFWNRQFIKLILMMNPNCFERRFGWLSLTSGWYHPGCGNYYEHQFGSVESITCYS